MTGGWSYNRMVAEKPNYDMKGKLNTDSYGEFKRICRMTQANLKRYLIKELHKYYEKDDIYSGDGFIYVLGVNSNVLLTAHMDTVHEPQGRTCHDIYEYYDKKKKQHILSSPQGIGGDDRCGVYTIMQVLETTELRPTILFCEDEEIGGIGSSKFCKIDTLVKDVTKNVTFMVEIDRANANDAVFYEENNKKFKQYVKDITGNTESYGSFSDISHLSPATGVSSFNISCGYYNAHTTSEYVVMEELYDCIQKVIKLLETNNEDGKAFEYEEFKWSGYGYYGYYGYGKDDEEMYEFQFNRNGEVVYEFYEGTSLTDCIGQLLMDYPDVCWNDVFDYNQYM